MMLIGSWVNRELHVFYMKKENTSMLDSKAQGTERPITFYSIYEFLSIWSYEAEQDILLTFGHVVVHTTRKKKKSVFWDFFEMMKETPRTLDKCLLKNIGLTKVYQIWFGS